MSTKMALHDDAREELVQSMGISHEEANRLINKNTPEARAAFEKVYDQKTQAIPNRPAAKQMAWTVGKADLRHQYSAQEETMGQKMAESKSKMKFEAKNTPEVSTKIQTINKNIESGRGNIQREKDKIVQKVDKRAEDGTVSRTWKQIVGEEKAVSDEKK
jgi:transcription initiation factor IIE alpha subunit